MQDRSISLIITYEEVTNSPPIHIELSNVYLFSMEPLVSTYAKLTQLHAKHGNTIRIFPRRDIPDIINSHVSTNWMEYKIYLIDPYRKKICIRIYVEEHISIQQKFIFKT